MKLILILCILFLPVTASAVDPVTWISDGVSLGLDKSMEKSADNLVSSATNISINSSAIEVNSNPLNNFILMLLSGYYDPTQLPWVISTRNFTALVYIVLAILYFCLGGGYHILHDAWPEIGSEVDWILGTNYRNFYYSQYAANGVKAFLFPVLGYFGLSYILLLAGALTRLIVSDTLTSITPSVTSGAVYLFMAIAVFLLAIFIAIRYILITIFSAYLLIILGAYLFDDVKPMAVSVLKYLFVMIFMPFVLAMIAGGGIAFIEGTPWLGFNRVVQYIALIILMLFAAALMVFGWRTIRGATKGAATVAVFA